MRLTSSCQEASPNFKLASSLKDDISRDESVVILDCRGNDEFRREHIKGAYNIVLPQLLQRRLRGNKLPLRNLVPGNINQEKDAFLSKVQTSTVIIYDQESTGLNGKETPLQILLHDRMAREGCDVAILKGGFAKFRTDYPEFCSSAGDKNLALGDYNSNENPGVGNDESGFSPYGYSESAFGLGSLTLAEHSLHSENISSDCSWSKGGDTGLLARRTHRNGRNFPRRLEIEQQSESSVLEQPLSHQSSSCHNGTSERPKTFSPASHHSHGNNTEPAEILPYLFLGCARDASSREILMQYNITYILNVTPNLPNIFEDDDRYHYKQIAISDHWSQNLSQFFPEAIAFIDEARSKKCGVLVHCLAGISRSVTVTVAYLMQKNRWSLNDAYDFVKQRKANVSPNFNFLGQLLDFEKTLGLNSDSVDDGISRSSNSTPTLFFTSPPSPAPNTMIVASNRKKQDYETLLQASCTES